MKNPFTDDIFTTIAPETDWVESLHREATAQLKEALPASDSVGALGKALIVSAPRAGFGKSHLVANFASSLSGQALVLPLTFDLESDIKWHRLLGEVLEKLHYDRGRHPGISLLDETSRQLFAQVNTWLIEDKKVPCAHPAEAVTALARSYVDMFDFSDENQPVARWFGEHIDRLAPLSANRLHQAAGLSPADSSYWLQVLCSYAQTGREPSERRLESLRWAVNTSQQSSASAGGMHIIQEGGNPELPAKQKLTSLARLLSLVRPLVFVIDHLDVFYRDGKAGLKIAYFISELRRLAPHSLTVVCVNQDVWEATFRSQLPSALEDRMTGGFVPLRGLTVPEAETLVSKRLHSANIPAGKSTEFLQSLNLGQVFSQHAGRPVSPRAVLRYAAQSWENAARGLSATPLPPPPLAPIPTSPLAPLSLIDLDPPAASESDDEGAGPLGASSLASISDAVAALAAPVGSGLTLGAKTSTETSTSATPLPPVVAPSPAISEESRNAFQRLRERLEQIKPLAAGTDTQALSATHPITNPLGRSDAPLLAAFHEAQLRHQIQPHGSIYPDLAAVLRFAGQHFPVAHTSEFSLPGASGQALQWLTPDGEIVIGLEAPTAHPFWDSLCQQVIRRLPHDGPRKIVAITTETSPSQLHPAAALSFHASAPELEMIALDGPMRSKMSAFADLLAEHRQGSLTHSTEADLAGLLAVELAPFWKRFTRLRST